MREGKHRLRGVLTVFGKLAVTAALLAFILGRVDWEVLWQRSLDLRGGAVLLAFVSFLCIAVGEVSRMKVTLVGFGLGWVDFIRIHLIGGFFASFLPGQVGADLYRIHFLSGIDGKPDRPLTLVIVIRVVGFFVLVTAAIASLAVHGRELWSLVSLRATWPGVPIALLAVGIGLFGVCSQRRFRERFAMFYRRSRAVAAALTASQILSLAALSMAVLLMRVLMMYFLVAGTGIRISLDEALLVVTLATLLTMIPISFAGIGLREGAITALLVHFRVPYEEAVIVALLGRVFIVSLALTGGVWLMRETATGDREKTS